MTDEERRPADENVFSRLAGRGEEAVTRLVDELGRNSLVTDAIARAMAAKGKVDETTRRTLAQVGLAPSDDVRELEGRLEALEARLARLEGTKSGASRSRTGRKAAPSTKASGAAPKKSTRAAQSGSSGSSGGGAGSTS